MFVCVWEKSEGKTYAKKRQIRHEDTLYSAKPGSFFEVFSLPYLIFVTFVVIYTCVSVHLWNRPRLFFLFFCFFCKGMVVSLFVFWTCVNTKAHNRFVLNTFTWASLPYLPTLACLYERWSWGCRSFLRKFLCLRRNLTHYIERPGAFDPLY